MLVLTREDNQRIKVGDDVTIVVVESRNGKCRIGIDAPKNVKVHRQEVYDAIKRGEKPKCPDSLT